MNPVLAETLLSLTDLAKRCPRGRGAGPTHCAHRATVLRWVVRGVRVGSARVKLEACRVGGRWVTSEQAYERFVTACGAAAGAEPVARQRTPAQARRAADAAGRAIRKLMAAN